MSKVDFFRYKPFRAIGKGLLGIVLISPVLALEAQSDASVRDIDRNIFPIAQVSSEDTKVVISEVIIEGLDGHPEQERLEFAAYDAMRVRPGGTTTRRQLQLELDAIYATGWFSSVRVEPLNGPLGVQIIVQVEPNPILREVKLDVENAQLPIEIIREIFINDYGKTINLNTLQLRIKELKKWYLDEGFSLARISGSNRIAPNGVIELKVVQGIVNAVEVEFLNKEGESTDIEGNKIKGKTRIWVVTREISLKPGDPFNRNQLESDIRRLYETKLFSDVKVTLKPLPEKPGHVSIVLGITEQNTGSLTGGIGYSQSQGGFGQIGVQEENLLGRRWNSSLNITYGEYGGLVNFSFADPWIKGDPHRTSFQTSLFISREVPQEFRSQEGGSIRGASDYYDSAASNTAYDINSTNNPESSTFDSVPLAKAANSNVSWFDYEDNSVALSRTGGSFSLARPLNGGDPYKDAPWSVLVGMNIQQVRPIDYAGNSRPYGVSTDGLSDGTASDDDVICIAFNCKKENNLVGVRAATNFNTLNNPANPTAGDFFSFGTEQYISIGDNSPTFNRARATYSHFFPVNWLKISKGCRPGPGEVEDCPQAIAFQVRGGGIIGELPPYEAFCVGGSNSIRGWSACDLAVGRHYGEATLEYRFPVWSLISGAFFVEGATDFGSQKAVPGKPGKLLEKPGSGFSVGSGVILNTPVGPLRLEAASKDLSGDWRFNLGVGWKF